jgi:hypothetical protein
MTTSVYPIFRAIGRPLLFKGFRAQYIVFAGASLIADLLLFVLLYVCRVPSIVCMAITFTIGAAALAIAARLSRFGSHGLMKMLAARQLPRSIACKSRRIFIHLLKQNRVHPTASKAPNPGDRS